MQPAYGQALARQPIKTGPFAAIQKQTKHELPTGFADVVRDKV